MATTIEKVRLLIGDISSVQFTDDQINIFLEMASDSVNIAAARALESWAASLSDSADSEHIGDYSYTKKQAANKMDLAARLRENEAYAPVSTWAEMNLTAGSAITEEED